MNRRLIFAVLLTACVAVPVGLLSRAMLAIAQEPAKTQAAAHGDSPSIEPVPKTPEETAAAKREEQEFFEMYKALADTVDQVDRNYVKKVDRRELMEAAIKGVLTKLDPYSSYIGPEDAGHFRDTVENQFGGIGIQITSDGGQLKVLSPLVGSPAYKAGLQSGDRILKIGDQSAAGMVLDDAVHKLKGDVGTSVSLTVAHAGGGKQETVTVNRELIHVDTVLGDHRKSDDNWDFMLDADKHIGYIRITTFSRDTAQDLQEGDGRTQGPQAPRTDPRPAIQSGRTVDGRRGNLRHVSQRRADRQHRRAEFTEASLGRHEKDRCLHGLSDGRAGEPL